MMTTNNGIIQHYILFVKSLSYKWIKIYITIDKKL